MGLGNKRAMTKYLRNASLQDKWRDQVRERSMKKAAEKKKRHLLFIFNRWSIYRFINLSIKGAATKEYITLQPPKGNQILTFK